MSKTYLLVGVLIAVAIVNLLALYGTQESIANESYSIIRAGDLKTKTETIAGLATSVANGREADRVSLEKEINEFDTILSTLKSGGTIRGQVISPIPNDISQDYTTMASRWNEYRKEAIAVQSSSLYNKEVVSAINYVLDKNTDLILTSDSLVKDLETLDRNYNTHKEIAANLRETAKTIGQDALLVSLGQDEIARQNLQMARKTFDVGLGKLLQTPLKDDDYIGTNISKEPIAAIPRENSKSLDDLDLLWEAVGSRIKVIEAKSLYTQTDNPVSKMNVQRQNLLESIDNFLGVWNADRIERRNNNIALTEVVSGIDIAVFTVVLLTIRRSLGPLENITRALAKVKDGIYGEKINYSTKDEIGELASSFNTMSETIRVKEEEARKTDIAKDEFLAMITHELKTPLVPIRGYADILLSGHLGEITDKQRERINIIKSSATSLLQLISDLLDVQKLELGQLKIQKEDADIHDTVLKSVQTLQPQIEEQNIKIVNEVSHHVIPHDPDRIGQVLTNLIKNSLKAIKPGSGMVRIYSEQTPDEIRIIVSDNGLGVPYEKQGKLFTKFYQADASMTREKGGSGLGLSICKGIVEIHGGKISMQSTPNSGTTVTFSLPVKEHKSAI
ncbi:MAG: HAMP domain-containing protein [Nitrosopumilaceae archaeon]|nr:HAMP domain-containing protein [Nitrosopumilaceae archaeon]